MGAKSIIVNIVERYQGSGAAKKIEAELKSLGPAGDVALKGIDKLTTGISSRFGLASGSVKSSLDGMAQNAVTSGGVMGAGVAAGAAVAATAVAEFVKKGIADFLEWADQARAVQNVTGATAQDASLLAAEFRAVGIDVGAASGVLAKLEKNIGSNAKALQDYNIQVVRNKDGSVNTLATLHNLSQAFVTNTDRSKADAAAAAVLGKGYATLLPYLARGAEALKLIDEEAKAHHEVFDQHQIDAAHNFELSSRALHEELTGLTAEVGSDVVPTLTELVAGITKIVEAADKAGHAVAGLADHIPGPLKQAARIITDITVPLKGPIDLITVLGKHSSDAAKDQQKLADAAAETTAELTAEAEAAKKALDQVEQLAEAPLKEADAVEQLRQAEDKLNQVRAEDPSAERARAERDHAAAVRDVDDAKQRLADAEKKLNGFSGEGLRIARQRAAIDKEQADAAAGRAKLDLQAAQRELELAKQANVSPEAIAEQTQKVAEAQANVDDANQKAADSQKAVNDLQDPTKSDDYKQAQRDVADAKQGVADANQKVAATEQAIQNLHPDDHARKVAQAERDVNEAILNVGRNAGPTADAVIAAYRNIFNTVPPEFQSFVQAQIDALTALTGGTTSTGPIGPQGPQSTDSSAFPTHGDFGTGSAPAPGPVAPAGPQGDSINSGPSRPASDRLSSFGTDKTSIYIGQVVAHDYADFTRQLETRKRMANLNRG